MHVIFLLREEIRLTNFEIRNTSQINQKNY
jgi:hypothetical protein